MRQLVLRALASSAALCLAACSSMASGVDWWRLCDCSPSRDLDDCVVNEDPEEPGQVTSSGELVDGGGGGALARAAGGSALQLASLAPALGGGAPAVVSAEICLYPVDEMTVGGATAGGGQEHLLGISGLNSQSPVAKLVSPGGGGPVDVEVDAVPVLTSYTDMGWSIVEGDGAAYLYVHGGEPTSGDRGTTNGVRIRLAK